MAGSGHPTGSRFTACREQLAPLPAPPHLLKEGVTRRVGGAGQLTALQSVFVLVASELGEQGMAGLEGHPTVPRERARKSSLLNPLSRPADTGMPPLGYDTYLSEPKFPHLCERQRKSSEKALLLVSSKRTMD